MSPFDPAMTGVMPMVCMCCKRQYGTKPCMPAMHGFASHGVCSDCEAPYRATMTGEMDEEALRAQFIPGGALAQVCGLQEARLRAVFPREWRDVVDWIVVGPACAVRITSLPGLVAEFAVSGERAAAGRLMDWIRERCAPAEVLYVSPQCEHFDRAIEVEATQVVDAPNPPVLRSWAAQWEADHE